MCENLYVGASRHAAAYGEGALVVQIKGLFKWCMNVDLKIEYGFLIWVFPAPFWNAHLTDHRRYTTPEAR